MPADAPRAASGPGALSLLLGVVYINIAGFSLILPLLPFYGRAFNASPVEIAALFAAYSLGNLFGETYWGRLSDRIGRRRVLIVSIACAALSYVAFAFAPTLIAALALRIVSGFFSGTMAVVQGYIADITPPEKRAGRMGLFGAAFNLGFVTGPSIGGLLARPELGAEGFRIPIFTAAAFAGAAALWALLFLREPQRAQATQIAAGLTRLEALRFARKHPVVGGMILIGFLAVASFASAEAVFGLWTEARYGWGPREVGLAFIGIGLAGCITQGLLVGPLSRRYGEARIVVAGMAALGVSLILLPLMRDPGATIALMSLLMVGHSLAFPNIAALISRATAAESQGAVMSVHVSASALARIVGPPALGVVYVAQGPDMPYFVCAALIGAAALVAIRVARPPQPGRRIVQDARP